MENLRPFLNHLAIPIGSANEIIDFYENILGFSELYRFEIDRESSGKIFNILKLINVIVVEREGLKMELYLTDELKKPGIDHICLNMKGVEEIADKAEISGYPVVRFERTSGILSFISDHSGNRFEIKELTF